MGFGAHQKFIGQNIPGADEELSLPNEFPELFPFFGTNFRIILENYRLSIQGEGVVVSLAGKNREEMVYKFHQVKPEGLEGLVPLSIPMGVGNEMEVYWKSFPSLSFYQFLGNLEIEPDVFRRNGMGEVIPHTEAIPRTVPAKTRTAFHFPTDILGTSLLKNPPVEVADENLCLPVASAQDFQVSVRLGKKPIGPAP